MIKTKPLADPPAPSDGRRVLIARYRPRGVPRGDEPWHAWEKRLAPSAALLDSFHGKQRSGGRIVARGLAGLSWTDYERRFREEMRGPEASSALDAIAASSASGQTITLLCYCVEERRCHRSVVRDLLAERERAFRGGT